MSGRPTTACYRLTPGVEVLRPGGADVVLRGPKRELRLDGKVFALLADRVLPLLDGRRTLDEVAASVPELDPDILRAHLDELVKTGALLASEAPFDPARSPLHELLLALDMEEEEARRRLTETRVAIFGLASHGAHLAALLHRCGIGTLHLVDPYPCREADRVLLPAVPDAAVGRAREVVVRDLIRGGGGEGEVVVSDTAAVDEDLVRRTAENVDLIVGAFDHELAATTYWVNRAALDVGRPALFGALGLDRATAGPLVVPGETPCFLCWRMRRLACADDVAVAMAREQARDARREPTLAPAPAWPPLAVSLAGRLASQVLETVLGLDAVGLAGRVETHGFPGGATEIDRVLERADCPACGATTRTVSPAPEGVLAAADFVGASCGWVRDLTRLAKDPSEPERPFVFKAMLANHRFRGSEGEPFLSCSGKGMTIDEAKTSALGEAAERYAGTHPGSLPVTRCTRAELDGPALDPRRLVLFAPEQYERLPYEPYDEESVVAWVRGRALGSQEAIYVPAVAVVLEHSVQQGEAHLCPMTSNGLAAGPGRTEAILSGLLEVLERDALLHAWLHRLPTRRVDPSTHPDRGIVELCRAYGRRGVSMELYALPTDHPVHVFAGLAVEPDAEVGPAVVVGLGADLDPARAARSALLEVGQVRPALRIHLREPGIRERVRELMNDPHAVTELDDHNLFYAHPCMLDRFAFLRDREVEELTWCADEEARDRDAAGQLKLLVDHSCARDLEPIAVDLTSPDLARFGVHAARVLVPDLQPMHFGRGERRLGGTRLFTLPRQLGFRVDDAGPADLNDDPHPVA